MMTTWMGSNAPVMRLAFPRDVEVLLPASVAMTMGLMTALGVVLVGHRRTSKRVVKLGLGLGLYSLVVVPASAVADAGVGDCVIQLIVVTIVTAWVAILVGHALRRQEGEITAQLRLSRTAERDHELRNGLAGLVEVTGLLSEHSNNDDTRALRDAVRSELARLETLLAAKPSAPTKPKNDARYDVAAVLKDPVALRRAAGMDIRLDIEPNLVAAGSPTTLRQVIVNLLANCARHAPGSPVRIEATRRPDAVIIRVIDFGPGLPPGAEQAVFERGARNSTTGGLGLGLHICRKLLTAEGGKIAVRPTPGQTGCTVTLHLPLADKPSSLGVADR
jgi:two-component system OmpR family sensor kinase